MSLNYEKENLRGEDGGNVKIVIKGSDDKTQQGAHSIYAFCNHCKKDISVVYIKSENNGKDVCVSESLSPKWPVANNHNDYQENDYDKCHRNNDYEGCKKLLDEKKKKRKIKELWETFLESCTLHGFHYCFSGNPPLRRIVWTILLLGAFAMFFEKCSESIKSYFEYPFTTTTLLTYTDRLPFPAVSLCNYNDARLSKMNGTLMDDIYVKSKLEGKNVSHLKSKLNGDLMKTTLKNAAHRLEDMIKECTWQKSKRPCSSMNFTHFKTADGDSCYTFNSGKKGKILETTTVGAKEGLRLLIDVQHHDYYYDVKNAGFTVILHDQDESPVKMQGISVAPGFATYMALKRRKVTNLPLPYKTACGMPKLKYFDTYTKSKCFLDKLTRYVDAKCKCRDWFMPGDNIPVCDLPLAENCLWPAWAYFEGNRLDNCPIACNSIEYSAQLSYARFPANNYAQTLAKQYGLNGTPKENREFLRDNLMEIRIYYEDLTFSDVQQVPSYDLFGLLGDVGGQIGLFLGASLLTIVEYFDVLGMMAYASYKYRN